MKESVLKKKSYEFAIKIVKLYKFLVNDKKEFVLSKQLLRAGTSIWALVHEAEFWQSKADFINKLSIALKEANESLYCWIYWKNLNISITTSIKVVMNFVVKYWKCLYLV